MKKAYRRVYYSVYQETLSQGKTHLPLEVSNLKEAKKVAMSLGLRSEIYRNIETRNRKGKTRYFGEKSPLIYKGNRHGKSKAEKAFQKRK